MGIRAWNSGNGRDCDWDYLTWAGDWEGGQIRRGRPDQGREARGDDPDQDDDPFKGLRDPAGGQTRGAAGLGREARPGEGDPEDDDQIKAARDHNRWI